MKATKDTEVRTFATGIVRENAQCGSRDSADVGVDQRLVQRASKVFVHPQTCCEVSWERAPSVTTTTLCHSRKPSSPRPQKALRAHPTLSVTPSEILRVSKDR